MQGMHGGTTLQWEHPGGLPGYGAVNTASRAAVGSGAGQHFPCDGSCESLQVLGDRVRKAGWFTAVGVWREQGQEEAGCLVLCVCSHVVDPSVGTWCSEPVLTWPSLGAILSLLHPLLWQVDSLLLEPTGEPFVVYMC